MTTKNGLELFRKLPAWLSPQECNVIEAVSLKAIWEQGRQGTGYEKSDLLQHTAVSWIVQRALDEIGNPSKFDAWLLHYPVGSEIPPHTDPPHEGMCHVRLNALVNATSGGLLYLDNTALPLNEGDAYLFRPDLIRHHVTAVEERSRLVLSVGANLEHEHAQAIGLASALA